jgi:hypothetical protein
MGARDAAKPCAFYAKRFTNYFYLLPIAWDPQISILGKNCITERGGRQNR